MYYGAYTKAFPSGKAFSFAISLKKAPDWVLSLYLKVVAAVVIGGLVLPVEVDKVVEDGALGVV